MSKQFKQLEKYTEASLAVARYKEKNAKVFDQLNVLLIAQQDAELALKKFVKDEVKGHIQNEHYKVTYSPAHSKGYDPTVVLKMATPKLRKQMVEAGAFVIEEKIVADKFVEMVEKGLVPVEIKQAAFVEKELSPRVSIKENK